MTYTHMTLEESKTLQNEIDMPNVELGNPKFILGVIMVMTALLGMWGVLCLVGGLANCDTVQELAKGFVTAYSGL